MFDLWHWNMKEGHIYSNVYQNYHYNQEEGTQITDFDFQEVFKC